MRYCTLQEIGEFKLRLSGFSYMFFWVTPHAAYVDVWDGDIHQGEITYNHVEVTLW